MKLLLFYLVFAFFGFWLLFCTHLTLNVTSSLPYHGFFCIKGIRVKKGDLVCLKGHETAYTPCLSFTKRLLGLPGDTIEIKDKEVFVGGQKAGTLQEYTKDGKTLTPIKNGVVPKGFVFLSADHPRSFDSRYQEFGLVDQGCIQGRCFGLLKKRSKP